MRRTERLVVIGLIAALVVVGLNFLGLLPLPFFIGFAPLPFLMLLGAAVAVLGALDAALYPDSAWAAADQNKIVWVGFQLGGLLVFAVPGVLAALMYFSVIRPKLKARSPVA
jgi:hypothetical protein